MFPNGISILAMDSALPWTLTICLCTLVTEWAIWNAPPLHPRRGGWEWPGAFCLARAAQGV